MLIEECVGAGDYDDEYNPTYEGWNRRTVTGMDNNPRMKEMFVQLEYMIEEQIGKPRILKKEVKAYKGHVKKWQVLDDECFDRD